MEILGSPLGEYDFPIPKYTLFPEIFRKNNDKCHINERRRMSGLKPHDYDVSSYTAINGRVNQYLTDNTIYQNGMPINSAFQV